MSKMSCGVCGYVYDPDEGDESGGVAAGTSWDDLPDDWHCPVCAASKDIFHPME